MGNWKILESNFVHDVYLISNQIASNPQNTFYGKMRSRGDYPLDMESPWFLIAVLSMAERNDCFTFQLCTFDADLYENLKRTNLDPLNSHYTASFISLSKEDLSEVINILSLHSAHLDENVLASTKMFEELDQKGIQNLKPPSFQTGGIITKFYVQKYNPVSGRSDDQKVTIIRTNVNLKKPERKLSLGIYEFDKEALDDPKSPYLKMLDTSIGRINLDQNGALELCSILREQTEYL